MTGNVRREALDEIILECLLAGKNYKDTAAEAGVDERTVRRHVDTDEFRAKFRAERATRREERAARLVAAQHEAAENLLELMRHSTADEVRLRATQTVLDHADNAHLLD